MTWCLVLHGMCIRIPTVLPKYQGQSSKHHYYFSSSLISGSTGYLNVFDVRRIDGPGKGDADAGRYSSSIITRTWIMSRFCLTGTMIGPLLSLLLVGLPSNKGQKSGSSTLSYTDRLPIMRFSLRRFGYDAIVRPLFLLWLSLCLD